MWNIRDIPAEDVDNVVERCGQIFQNTMLAGMCIPEVLETQSAMCLTYDQVMRMAGDGWGLIQQMLRQVRRLIDCFVLCDIEYADRHLGTGRRVDETDQAVRRAADVPSEPAQDATEQVRRARQQRLSSRRALGGHGHWRVGSSLRDDVRGGGRALGGCLFGLRIDVMVIAELTGPSKGDRRDVRCQLETDTAARAADDDRS